MNMQDRDQALQSVMFNTSPGERYRASKRKFQGIPSIERTIDGNLWAAFYSGGWEEGADNYVVLTRSKDNGRTWDMKLVIDPPGQVRAFDPCLWKDPLDRLWLFWSQSYGKYDGRCGVWASALKQEDMAEGRMWSTPRRIANGIMMNKPTVLTTGEWLLPAALWSFDEGLDVPKGGHIWEERYSNVYASSDQGETFHLRGQADVPRRSCDEHMIVERKNGELWMLVRTAYGIGESISTDRGMTWSPGKPTRLGGPNSRFFIRRLRSGKLLLVNHYGFDGRSHLTAQLSEDDGHSWNEGLLLDERADISYPDGVEAEDGTIYVIYDRDRLGQMELLMAVFTEEDVLAGHCLSAQSRLKVLVEKGGVSSELPAEVAVYYFPNYHRDPRNEKWHGADWTEWELVKAAQPRFQGHQQPKVPLWGYLDESKPETAVRQIEAAADHGIDAFIYDWYWYDDGPYLNGALEKGFLHAANKERLKFALMWANHDWVNIHPYKRSTTPEVLAAGKVGHAAFEAATEYIISNYFGQSNYWRVQGGLYFSIYELMRLVEGLGGIEQTAAALQRFRKKTRAAGLGELHLNAVLWGVQILPGETTVSNPGELLDALGFDSVTSYVWIHNVRLEHFPKTDYLAYGEKAAMDWHRLKGSHALPYLPNVTMGWDSSPRTVQTDAFEELGYPFISTLTNNTPERFEFFLREAKRFLASDPDGPRILTINAWNEWTEGSYLEPDTVNGMKYLEAVRRVFRK
jgi:predicted neuraminidase